MTQCECGRPLRYPSTGQCTRCYQRQYQREKRALLLHIGAVSAQPRGPRAEWRQTGKKRCRVCELVLPLERFGMQRNRGRADKPYSACIRCRTWQNHQRQVERSRHSKKGRHWRGETLDAARLWVMEKHWRAGAFQ